MVNGVQYVMMIGILLMLMWCVVSWDLDYREFQFMELVLVEDQDQSGWIVSHVLVMNQH